MPLVQPDVTGTTKALTVELPTDLALRTRAYAEMAKARIDSVLRVALERLLQEDKAEFDLWLGQHPDALDGRKLGQQARKKPAAEKKAPSAAAAS